MLRLWTMPGNERLIVVISSMQYHTSCSHLTFMWLDILYPQGILHWLQQARGRWELPLFLWQVEQVQLVVLEAGSVTLPGFSKLHRIRGAQWCHLPWLHQWGETVRTLIQHRKSFWIYDTSLISHHCQLPSPRMPPAIQMQGTLCGLLQNVPCRGVHCWM